MGNSTSKKVSVPTTPEKQLEASPAEMSPSVDETIKQSRMLEPKTPAPMVPQTPLTKTIANQIAKDDVQSNLAIQTPTYLLRKKILHDLGYRYSVMDTDPRSPSQCIPRTPVTLADVEAETSSFQYNSSLEDSCRDFNDRLDDITLEEPKDAEQSDEQETFHAERAPGSPSTDDCQSKAEDETDANQQTPETPDACENGVEKVKAVDKKLMTPSSNKSMRTGRIPLSVINHRRSPTEMTPTAKDLSFNKFDENRGSARKSKIPILKKSIQFE